MDDNNSGKGCLDILYLLSRSQYRQLQNRKGSSTNSHQQQNLGFSIVELIVVVLIIGILAGIAVPGWLAFVNRQSLRTANDRVHSALRRAKSNAKLNKETWQVSFGQATLDIDKNGTIEADEQDRVFWAVHPASVTDPNTLTVASESDGLGEYKLHPLEQGIEIDTSNTTMYSKTISGVKVYRMQFNYQGAANGRLGKLVLSHTNMGDTKKCVVVSTLLGAMRTDENDGCKKS